MAADQPDKIIVECASCSGKLRIAASSAGKKFKCPKCGQINTVPVQDPPAPLPAELDLGVGLTPSEAGGLPRTDYVPSAAPTASTMATGTTASGTIEKKPNALLSLFMKGSFVRGCLFSGICAVVGAIAWCVIAIVTDYEIGYLAWGIGIATGAGMAFGYQAKSVGAGAVAASFSVAGILLGKLLAVWFVIMPMIEVDMRKQDARVVKLAYNFREVEGLYRGLHPSDEAHNALYDERAEALAELSDAELDEKIIELEAWQNGGRDSDSEYVRHALAFYLIADEPDEPGYRYYRIYDVPPEEWPARHEKAMQQVLAMSESEQLESLKAYRMKMERHATVSMLAYTRAAAEAIKEGLAYADERRKTLVDKEIAALWELPDEAFKKAQEEQEAWAKEGRWTDQDYLRNFIIFSIVDRRIEDRAALVEHDEDEEYDEDEESAYDVAGPEWEALWTAAAQEIEGKENHELRAIADDIVREQEAAMEEFEEEDADYEAPSKTAQVAKITPFVLVAIIKELNPFDYLFFILALASAYGIAAREYGESE